MSTTPGPAAPEGRRPTLSLAERPMEGLLVGQTLADRYAIEEVTGRGGMSVVYRATDSRLGRSVAVKVVSLPSSGAERRFELRERLRREAASAARIPPHPNVVQVYDYGTDPALDLDFIVMELLAGSDLKQVIRESPPTVDQGLRILREAARGVAAGHRAGLVHRDVKPANIFMSGGEALGTAKILDFGIAKALEVDPDEDLTQTGLVPHSPAYASPEQLRGQRHLTAASDVYQLGLVAYELLAGERPFGEAERERMAAGESVEPPDRGRWTELDPAVRAVIARALSTEPADRFPDAEAFVEALSAAAEGDHTRTVHAVPIASRPAAAPPPEPEVVSTPVELEGTIDVVSSPHSPRRWHADRRVQLGVAGALVLLGLWGITSLGEPRPAVESAAAASELDVEALEEEFRELQREAATRLREEDSAEEGEEAANAVLRTLVDLNQSWVEGDLERHLSHYASRVDFYGADDARRSRIERERRADLERFPEREIVLERHAVEFPEPGRARALVDKSWSFAGPEERRSGAGRQEYLLELVDGRWRVVSERLLEQEGG
jgi:serine/threonine protein kinase